MNEKMNARPFYRAIIGLGSLCLLSAASAQAQSSPTKTNPKPPAIKGRYFQPTELMGEKLPNYPGTRKIYVHFTSDGGAKIFGGVNTFAGTYTLGDAYHFAGYDMVGVVFPLKFGPLAPTTKAMGASATKALENKFLKTLRATTGYRGDNSTLALIGGNKVIARFRQINNQ